MKNHLKKLAIAMIMFFSQTQNGHADKHKPILDQMEKDFDRAEGKLEFLRQRTNSENWERRGDEYHVKKGKSLYVSATDSERPGVHILTLVIFEGDIPLFKKFLSSVKDPNDLALFTEGGPPGVYLTLADLVLCKYPLSFETRSAMLDVLADKSFNFNSIVKDDPNYKLPLVQASLPNTEAAASKELRARLLLLGTDPELAKLEENDPSDLVNRAFDQVWRENLQDKIKPTNYVKNLLNQKREDHLKIINALQFLK